AEKLRLPAAHHWPAAGTMLRRAQRLVRTHAFRLAGLYFAVFVLSVLGVLFFVYWTSADFVERQTEATLDAEITGLAEQYAQRGLSGLVQIVAARSAGDRGDGMLYLIANRDGVKTTLVWSGLLALAVGLIGGTVMSRNMLRRVEEVNRTAERVIAGNLSDRVPRLGTADEFDQLAANLNSMLDQIERLMAGMREVTDNVAHDLKTPLARLRARLELALLAPGNTAAQIEAIRAAIGEADRMLATFNALLSIAEAEAGAGSGEGGSAVLEVSDRGPGIPERDREAVFDRFVRLEPSRSTPGNGLGLSLVRAVAHRHHATVALADNRPGLRVRLEFPEWTA